MTGNSNSGRKRKATSQRNGRISINLYAALVVVSENLTSFRKIGADDYSVDGIHFTDYRAAAAEFVRLANAR